MLEVWKRSHAQRAARLVVMAIAEEADDRTRYAVISGRGLAARMGLAHSTVRLAVAELMRLGELELDHQSGEATRYRVCLPIPHAPVAPPVAPTAADNGAPAAVLVLEPSRPAPMKGAKKKRTVANLCRWPDDFELTPDLIAFAEAGGLDARAEFAAFRDRHQAKGSRFVRWDLAFKGWCRNSLAFQERWKG